jgi:hypothetical protein
MEEWLTPIPNKSQSATNITLSSPQSVRSVLDFMTSRNALLFAR